MWWKQQVFCKKITDEYQQLVKDSFKVTTKWIYSLCKQCLAETELANFNLALQFVTLGNSDVEVRCCDVVLC